MSFSGLTPSFVKALVANMELDTDVHYFGDKDTDGSWRVIRDSGFLKVELRTGGTWILQFNFDASTQTLDSLSDVDTFGVLGNDVLSFDSGTNTWKPRTLDVPALNDISNVNAGAPADGDVLTYDSGAGKWVNQAPSGGGGGSAIPTSSTFKTTSYTIPVGKWAKVVPLDSTPVIFSGASVNLNASAIPKWTINSTTVYAGNATAVWATLSAGLNLTLPTECIARFSVWGWVTTGVTNGRITVGGVNLAQLNSAQETREGFLSCTGQNVTFNVNPVESSVVFNFFTLKPTNLVVKAGDVVSGSSNFRWLVQEFDV